MSFVESIRTCLGKYASFDGRATRSEFWWFYLFYALVGIVLVIPGALIMATGAPTDGSDSVGLGFFIGLLLIIAASVVQLAFLIPLLAVGSRRLHDRGQSGWMQLLLLVPCGNIVLIIFWILEGTPGDNPYGPKPA